MPPSAGIVALVIGITLLMGLAIGLFHALLINRIRLPPFIATLATMAGLRSVAGALGKNRTINVPFDSYRVLGAIPGYAGDLRGRGRRGEHHDGVHGAGPAHLRPGRQRDGRAAQRPADAPAQGDRVRPLGDALGAGGILFTGHERPGRRLGVTYELIAITAAVVGGCSLSGGIGSIRGTVLGLLLTQIVIKGTGLVGSGGSTAPRSRAWSWAS